MSTTRDEPDDDAAEGQPPDTAPPDPDSIRWLFFDPGVRNYLFAGLGALAMVFVILFALTGPIGAGLVVVLGVAGLLLRWPASPLLVLLVLLWFLVFPGGIPPGYENRFEITDGRFRVADVILTFSVVVYIVCHYRLYGLSAQAFPADGPPRKGDTPYRRPPDSIRPGEIGRLLAVVGGVVIAGQLVWFFVTNVEADPGAFVPIKPLEERPVYSRSEPPGSLRPWVSRFVILTGMIFFTALIARLAFGYWRLRNMGAAEAGMILQDGGWDETRRELVRIETWQAAAKKREADRAKAAAALLAKTAKKPGGRR